MMDDVAEFMREHYKSNKYDEILRNLSEQVDLLEVNEDLVIERNNNKGHYYAYQLSKTLKKIEKDWWWEDTEVFRAVYNQAAGYYTNLLDLSYLKRGDGKKAAKLEVGQSVVGGEDKNTYSLWVEVL